MWETTTGFAEAKWRSLLVTQMQTPRKDGIDTYKEVGVVGPNYLLLPNAEVRDAEHQVAFESNLDIEEEREFFDGKRYIYTLKSTDAVNEVIVGFEVVLGLLFCNSYDCSRAFCFSMMLYRLVL